MSRNGTIEILKTGRGEVGLQILPDGSNEVMRFFLHPKIAEGIANSLLNLAAQEQRILDLLAAAREKHNAN